MRGRDRADRRIADERRCDCVERLVRAWRQLDLAGEMDRLEDRNILEVAAIDDAFLDRAARTFEPSAIAIRVVDDTPVMPASRAYDTSPFWGGAQLEPRMPTDRGRARRGTSSSGTTPRRSGSTPFVIYVTSTKAELARLRAKKH
jgi:hypothetical protein